MKAKENFVIHLRFLSEGSSDTSSNETTTEDIVRRRPAKPSGDEQDLMMKINHLSRGELPFVGRGKIARQLKKQAKKQTKKWEQCNIKQTYKMLSSLESDLLRSHKDEAADNTSSVRSVIEHLNLAAVECPALSSTLEEASKDVVQMALNHSNMAQGSPAAWCVVLKHIIHKVAVLTATVEGSDKPRGSINHSSPPRHPKRDWKKERTTGGARHKARL